MAKIKKETVIARDPNDSEKYIVCKFDLCVDTEGVFYMRFSDEEIAKLKAANVAMERGYLKKEGYLSANSKDELINKVKQVWINFMSRIMIEEKVIIRYAIQTQASYAMTLEGVICPNPSKEWTGMEYGYDKEPRNKWRGGNVSIHASNAQPFGILIYAKPFVRRKYKYASGEVKAEYSRFGDIENSMQFNHGSDKDETTARAKFACEALEQGYNLRWLNAIPCIAEPDKVSTQEIDYTESVAEFFVNMIKSICQLNERIKDFMTPEAILILANSNNNILAPTNQ